MDTVSIREDLPALLQGITTPDNSGVNEGRITDAKLPKRVTAGRVGVPLLRHRVVPIAHLRRRYANPPTPETKMTSGHENLARASFGRTPTTCRGGPGPRIRTPF